MYLTNKNSVITPYEDTGGITNTNRSGERALGTDFYTGEELADLDTTLSRMTVCPRCAEPLKRHEPMIKQGGHRVCCRCADKEKR